MERLTLYLSPLDEVRFKVIADGPSVGEGETECVLPFGGAANRRTTILKSLDALAFQAGGFPDPEEQEWMVECGLLTPSHSAFCPDMRRRIGEAHYQSLFPDGSRSRELLLSSLQSAARGGTELHIQIKIAARASRRSRIAEYPWELLHDDEGFLAHRNVTFSRYIAYDTAPPRLPTVGQANVLLISSAASDPDNQLLPLPREESQAMREVLSRAEEDGHLRLATLEPATLDAYRAHLTSERGEKAPHVIHFDGHGYYGRRCANCRTINAAGAISCPRCEAPLTEPQGYLVFEGETAAHYVSAQEMGTLLQKTSAGDGTGQVGGPAVLVLTACRSGLSLGGDSVFHGVAQSLIEHRVPAVVAMLFPVRVDSSTAFTRQFYRSLAQRDSLATAISRGREAMGSDDNQWYRPVLYLRWHDNEGGQLFGLSSRVATGLTTLPDLMKAPRVQTAVDHFHTDFEVAREQIKVLSYLKNLHDQLHTLQIHCFDLIALEAPRFPDDDTAGERLGLYAEELQAIVSRVRDIVAAAPPSPLDTSWIRTLEQAEGELHAAIDTSARKPLTDSLRRMNRVLAIYPSQINTRLNGMMRDLRLPALHRAMESVRDSFARSELDTGKARQFAESVDALACLNRRLVDLLKEHDLWQIVDDDLRRTAAVLDFSTDDLELSWPDVRERSQVLRSRSADDWAQQLRAAEEKLDAAIQSANPIAMRQQFRSYRRKAGDRFYRVDVDLKRLCDELVTVGEALAAVLRYME